MTRYWHFRNRNEKGEIESCGGVTVAVVLFGGASRWGVARCSSRDNFSKKLGRVISEGRATSQTTYVVCGEYPDEEAANQAFNDFAVYLKEKTTKKEEK